ncbi:MAG TPA: rod shape-determining protein MreD [Anaerolineae bacterium]
MNPSVYLAVPVMLLLTVVQTAVLPHFPILGLTPQLPFLVALAWALLHGAEEGIVWAFVAGFFLDLFSIGPMGVTSLTFMVAVLAVTRIGQLLPSSRVFLPAILAGLATLLALFSYLLLLRLLGYLVSLQTATALASLALLHAGLVLPVYWLIYTLERVFRPRRVQL